MSEETYLKLCRYGFLMVIVVIQIPFVRYTLGRITLSSLMLLAQSFGVESQCVQWLISRH